MLTSNPSSLRCRKIGAEDIGPVAELLAEGFATRTPGDWRHILNQLGERAVPEGFPQYGFVLEKDGKSVGAVLLIFSPPSETDVNMRCNVSTWYVKPEFRSYASLLAAMAVKREPVTYINVSPAAHTFSILEAHKFARLCEGVFFALPALSGGLFKTGIKRLSTHEQAASLLTPAEADLIAAHNAYGCLSVACHVRGGDASPFIFRKRQTKFKGLPCAQLIYCRSMDEFTRHAGPLGRYLLRHCIPVVTFGADGKVPGLVGQFHGRPMYYRGAVKPRLGDLTYTEEALFGV